nr:DnaD domain protein [Polycladospora coralii]
MFERELGRTLSPMEYERLSSWVDDDGHSLELIESALREAVFSGKVNFRYIDRILLEWQKNQVRTPEEAVEYSRKFRQKGMLYRDDEASQKKNSNFLFYNWVNQE